VPFTWVVFYNCPMVRVSPVCYLRGTGAGAGGGTLSDWKNDKAGKMPEMAAESPASSMGVGVRFG
jgi:hypothetical protein